MWQAAANLVAHGSLAIPSPWPLNTPPGATGQYYPVAALLACLVHVPGAALQSLLVARAPARATEFLGLTSQLAPIFLGALAVALFFRLLQQEGFRGRAVAWATLLFGTATSIWVYAHRSYAEALQAACFTAFFAAVLRAADAPARAAALRLGLTAAVLINSKNSLAICFPGALIYLFMRLRTQPRVLASLGGWASLGLLPGLVALGAYNHARWGSIFSSGYGEVTVGFWRENPLTGLWGQLLSPGKSVFLYSPPLVLALAGLPRLWRRRPNVALAILLVVAPVVLVHARYLFWSGDWGWGPRYLVFALPALLLPAAELFGRDAPGAAPRPLRRAAVAGVLAVGVIVQGLGNLFHWHDYINVSREAAQAWLGRPDTSGTVLGDTPCFSCFEEMYPTQWLPPFQPIAGHAWLLRHKLAGDDWQTAEADAPWKRYTSVRLDIRKSYDAAVIDWWPLDAPGSRTWLIALVVSLVLLAAPARNWIRQMLPSATRSRSDVGIPPAPN